MLRESAVKLTDAGVLRAVSAVGERSARPVVTFGVGFAAERDATETRPPHTPREAPGSRRATLSPNVRKK